MTKGNLRKEYKELLAGMEKPEYEQRSFMIAHRLFQMKEWKQAETVGVTVSNLPEVDTWQIIRRGWEEGKTIVVPKCLPQSKEMVFKSLGLFTDLERVYYGLYEPKSTTTAVLKEDIHLMVVPGLAYTRKGYRLGFGGGYYDRYLSNYQGDTVSLAFDQQIVPSLPVEEYDIPVKYIITETEVVNCCD